MHRRVLLITIALLLAACASGPAQPQAAPTLTPSNTIAPAGLASAADAASAFVGALNARDFPAAYAMLDDSARASLIDAAGLQSAYAGAMQAARVEKIEGQLRGGLLQEQGAARATLVSTWQSALFGNFDITTTLRMIDDHGWRISWNRNAIVNGLDGGQFVIEQQRPPRAAIYGSDGTLLVGPVQRTTLGVTPNLIKDAADEQAMLAVLARLTGLTAEEIKDKYFGLPANWYVPIADIDEDLADKNSDALQPFAALSAQPTVGRKFYRPEIAPHVTGLTGAITPETRDAWLAKGYTADERVGITGVEAAAESILSGQPEYSLALLGDARKRILAVRPPVKGVDVTLTLSPALQLAVQGLLEHRKGAAMVLRVRDGALLSMASFPTYVPEHIANDDVRAGALLNRATQGLYPPGSVFKMVTMAAGLGEGVAAPNTIFVDPGYWLGYGEAFRKTCWRKGGHGRITLQDGLTASCNIVFYELGRMLQDKGDTLLPGYARKFGFGAPTGIDLAAEQGGVVPDPDYKQQATGEGWRPGDTVNMAVGQGFVLVTPLQIARMTAAIANGGALVTPHVIAAPAQPAPEPARLPIAPEHLAAMQQAMLGVTTNARIGTTTYRFAGFDYYQVNDGWYAGNRLSPAQRKSARKLQVAGKSGTAQAPGDALSFAWFTAYAPADAPEIAVTVLLENAGQGSGQAGPVARQIIENYFGLPVSATPKDALEND